jgi:hypothetical protein
VTGAGRRPVRRVLLAVPLAGTALALTVWAMTPPAPARSPAVVPGVSLSAGDWTRATGLRVDRVAVSGGGGLVDLRYTVVDAVAARGHAAHPPMLVDERTGTRVGEPWMGHAHARGGPTTEGRAGYALLRNPGGVVTPGGSVSVLLGDLRLPGVPVR